MRMICAGIMLAFAFIDLLGSVLFMPGLGALCQRAEGGPSASMGNALLLPSGALETEDMKGLVPAELVLLHKELDAPIPCSGAALQIDADMVYPVAPWGMCTTAAGEAAPSKADGCTSTWTADPGQPCLLREVHTPASAAHLAWSRIGNPRAFDKVPFRFSTAMNFLLVAEGVFTGLGGILWGRLADMMPIKILSQINIVGVLCAYVVMYLSGVHWNSFWGFAAGYALNGLFAGVGVLAPIYFRKAFPPEEGQMYFALLTLNEMVGLGVGTLILMPFISGRGENLFNAAWIGVAGSSVVFVLITRFLVEPKQTAKQAKIDESRAAEKETKTQKTPALVIKILWTLIVAAAFDAAGDEGTRMARGTILQNVFPETNTASFQNVLLLSCIGMAMVALALTMLGQVVVGLPSTAVFGTVATVATQVVASLLICVCMDDDMACLIQLPLSLSFSSPSLQIPPCVVISLSLARSLVLSLSLRNSDSLSAWQLLFMLINFQDYGSFLAAWFAGKVFGMCSTFANEFLMQDMMPEHEAGKWNGIKMAVNAIVTNLSTLAMSMTYDQVHFSSLFCFFVRSACACSSEVMVTLYSPTSLVLLRGICNTDQRSPFSQVLKSANKAAEEDPLDVTLQDKREGALRGKSMLLICVCISCIAVLCYIPTTWLIPKKKRDKEQDKKRFRTVDEYFAASEQELRQMTLEETSCILEQMMNEDPPRMPRAIAWGRYSDQREELVAKGGLQDRALQDFKYMRQRTLDILTSQDKMEEERMGMKMMREWEEANVDKEAAKAEMGRWIADYLDDAGYDNWASYPTIYKAMFVNAFPPIDPLDDKAADPDTADIEHLATEFLKVADSHIQHNRANNALRLRAPGTQGRGFR